MKKIKGQTEGNTKYSTKRIVLLAFPPIVAILLFWVVVEQFITPTLRESYYSSRKQTVEQVMQVAWDRLNVVHQLEKSHRLTQEESQKQALDIFRNLRYGHGNRDYFWITDTASNVLMHPYQDHIVGLNLSTYLDPDGIRPVEEMTRIAKSQGQGFLRYKWQMKEDTTRVESKISLVRLFEPWGWVIGTGVYIVDIETNLQQFQLKIRTILAGIFAVILLVVAIMFWQLLLAERRRMKAQEEKEKQDAFNKALFVSSGDGILVLHNETIINANPAAAKIFGTSIPSQLEKRSVVELSPKKQNNNRSSREEAIRLISNVRNGKVQNFKWTHRRTNGEEFPCEVTLSPILEEKPDFYVAIIRDISERQKTENQLRQSQKMESIGRLTGGIAHDFNNILSSIIGSAELALDNPEIDSQTMEYLHVIQGSAVSASELTGKLLAFSRKSPDQHRSIEVQSLITETLDIFKHAIKTNIAVLPELPEKPLFISGDKSELQNAILNLLINSRDAMPDGGNVGISLVHQELDPEQMDAMGLKGESGQFLLIRVSDTGIGIPKRIQDEIFEPFFTTKGEQKGTGLGLSTVYSTVKKHGGTIQLYSEVSVGTVFNIYLPAENQTNTRVHPAVVALIPGLRVLLVDDDEAGRLTITGTLERLGMKVTLSESGEHALEHYSDKLDEFDLLFLDIIMPGMDGTQLLKALRKIRPEIPALISSGFNPKDIPHMLNKLERAAYLQKPFGKAELRKVISDLITDL